jgi:hypothetical protein
MRDFSAKLNVFPVHKWDSNTADSGFRRDFAALPDRRWRAAIRAPMNEKLAEAKGRDAIFASHLQ